MDAKERQMKKRQLEQAVKAITGDAPVTIGEDGEVRPGAHTDDIMEAHSAFNTEAFGLALMYGVCPVRETTAGTPCLRIDRVISYGRESWGICERHHKRWLGALGQPLDNQTASEWLAAKTTLEQYRFTLRPYYASAEQPGGQIEMSFVERNEECNRLWILLQSERWTRDELRWLLAEGNLSRDLVWLVRQKLKAISSSF